MWMLCGRDECKTEDIAKKKKQQKNKLLSILLMKQKLKRTRIDVGWELRSNSGDKKRKD